MVRVSRNETGSSGPGAQSDRGSGLRVAPLLLGRSRTIRSLDALPGSLPFLPDHQDVAGLGPLARTDDPSLLHHSLYDSILARRPVKSQQEHGIVDRQGIEGLFDVRPDRRPLRLKIDLKWALMREKIIDGDVVNRAVRRPEPGEWRTECTDDVLSRCDRHMPLVGRAAE